LLTGRGFRKVYNVRGGMEAWNGRIAQGPVEFGVGLIPSGSGPADIVRVAYGMEMTLGSFYKTMARRVADQDVRDLMKRLAAIEDKHKLQVIGALADVARIELDPADLEVDVSVTIMEGGLAVERFMQANEPFVQTIPGLLEIAMMLETQSLDLYRRLADHVESALGKEILLRISDEEKEHLAALGRMMDEKV
jgi:rubrerythrin